MSLEDVFLQALPKWFVQYDPTKQHITITLRHGSRVYNAKVRVNLNLFITDTAITSDDIAINAFFQEFYVSAMRQFIQDISSAKNTDKASEVLRKQIVGELE